MTGEKLMKNSIYGKIQTIPIRLPYKRYCIGIVAGRETLRLDKYYRLNAICAPAFTHPDDILIAVIHHEPNQEKKTELFSESYSLNLPLSCLGLVNGSVSEISKLTAEQLPAFGKGGWLEFRLNSPKTDRHLLLVLDEVI